MGVLSALPSICWGEPLFTPIPAPRFCRSDITEGGQAPGVFDMHNRQRLCCTKSKIFTLAYQ